MGLIMLVVERETSTRVSLKNVLFATDFSSVAEGALAYALAICRHYGSMLHAAHAIPEVDILVKAEAVAPDLLDSGYEAVRRAAIRRMMHLSSALENIPHRIYVHQGDVWNVLSKIISKENVDLVVLGTHGRTGLGRLLMGSVAEQILRQAPCPVLTIGRRACGGLRKDCQPDGKELAPEEIEFREIISATDFSPESIAAAKYAISLAEEFQAGLALLHVVEETDRDQPSPTEWALERLESLVPEDAALWCKPRMVIKFGFPAECILKTAAERNADLIVLGLRTAAHLGIETHLTRGTTHKVVADTCCPVLTIASREGGTDVWSTEARQSYARYEF
jgi:nucleotide-binding universal stress UspA family protein